MFWLLSKTLYLEDKRAKMGTVRKSGGSLLTDNPKTKQVTDNSVTCFSIQRRGRLQNLQNHRKS